MDAEPVPIPTYKQSWFQYVSLIKGLPLTFKLSDNAKAGATVALVNIPLGISLSLAGGGTPTQGIVTTFWGGLMAATVGDSHFNIVGTTGALSGLLHNVVAAHGSAALPVVAILTSVLLFVAFFARLDRLTRYISTPVAEGFSVAVAIIIGCSQFPSAFGLTGLQPRETFFAKLAMSLSCMSTARYQDAVTFFVSFAALFLLTKWKGTIPWAIVIATVGIALGTYLPIGTLTLLRTKFPSIPAVLILPLDWTMVSGLATSEASIWLSCVGVACVAALETIISAEIGNRMAKIVKPLNTNREMLGVAVSNAVSGAMGGIPCTAALARTSLNVRSGATSRMSVIICALLVGLISMFVMPFFSEIPMACIAAILFMVAYRLINFHEIELMFEADAPGAYVFMMTLASCLLLDTFYGLIVGAAASCLVTWSERMPMITVADISTGSARGARAVHVRVLSSLLFVNRAVTRELLWSAFATLPRREGYQPESEEEEKQLLVTKQALGEVDDDAAASSGPSILLRIDVGPLVQFDVDGAVLLGDFINYAKKELGGSVVVTVDCSELTFMTLRHFEAFKHWSKPGAPVS